MKLKLDRMASGTLSITLQESVSWEAFEDLAPKWIKKIGAKLIDRADSVDERVWSIEYVGRSFWISYDDYQSSITLEPKEAIEDETMLSIAEDIEKIV